MIFRPYHNSENIDESLVPDGWRHADEQPKPETPAWTPTVGDVVQLKSGGPKMTVFEVKPDEVWCTYFDGKIIEHAFPQACLTPVTE